MTVGLRIDWLGSKKLTWRDLKVVAVGSPPGGALHRSVDPKGARWSPDTYLLAAANDRLALQIWQAGSGKGPKPKPMARPNDAPKKTKSLTAEALKQRANDGR